MKPIAESQLRRQQFRDILLIAILLGVGIGLMTTSISDALGDRTLLTATLGASLVVAGLFLTYRGQRKRTGDVLRLGGALAFEVNDEEIKPLRIYDYEFNDELCKNLSAFLAENAAYKKKFVSHFIGKKDRLDQHSSPSYKFFQETIISVVEFVLLDKLDLHLNAYFVDNEIDTSTIKRIEREDLPLSVLNNKVIDTLTKHYSEREAFMDSDFDEDIGELYYATGENGEVYNRLPVELPPGSTINRAANGALVIKNRHFSLSLLVKFEGSHTYVDSELIEQIDDDHFSPYSVRVNLTATSSPPLFQRSSANEIYRWLDSYVDHIRELVSIEALEKRLNPEFRKFMWANSRRRWP